MPPLNPNPIPPQQIKPPGMDSQTKKIVLFAMIFSVLAVVVVAAFVLRPGNKTGATAQSNSISTTTQFITSTTTAKKSIFSSFFNFNFGSPNQTAKQNLFSITTKTSSTSKTSTAPRPTAAPKTKTTSVPTTNVPYKQLEGIYSERPSAETQVGLELFQTDLPSSPLRGKLWISGVHRATKADQEYVTISTKSTLPPGTLITDMTLKSVVSGEVLTIPKGVGLPFANQINQADPIYINPGQKIYVVSGISPLGYSFRINKCTGYFEQFQNFYPMLPLTCPIIKSYPRPAPPNELSDKCITTISNLSRCKLPASYTDPGTNDQEHDCVTFIQDHVGYDNCVNLERYNTDFLGTGWWTYENHGTPVWKTTREIIWLLDRDGKFISQYSY